MPVLDGREEKVHVRPNPAIESIAVLAEMFCPRVLDHIRVGEPVPSLSVGDVKNDFRILTVIDSPRAENSVATRLWLVKVTQNELACL